jgi:hypothetical protein
MNKILQELILAEPTRALEIPDALPILVTEETVQRNIPELSIFYCNIAQDNEEFFYFHKKCCYIGLQFLPLVLSPSLAVLINHIH